MKLMIIDGGNDNNLHELINIIKNTFNELHIDIDIIRLCDYDFNKVEINNIINSFDEYEAIFIASPVILLSTSSHVKYLLESLMATNKMQDKIVFSIAVSYFMGEREVGEYILKASGLLGAKEAGMICLNIREGINKSDIEYIERSVEDFYRIIRQKRNIPKSSISLLYNNKIEDIIPIIDNARDEKEEIEGKIKAWNPPNISGNNINYNEFEAKQEKDIEEIALLFKEKMSKNNKKEREVSTKNDIINNIATYSKVPTKHEKTCKQLVQSMPHYYKPELNEDYSAVIQLVINGKENFNAYLMIDNRECNYFDGNYETPSIIINTSDDTFENILRGKISSQKAFMTGQIKVRGNFMLLSKMDKIFRKM